MLGLDLSLTATGAAGNAGGGWARVIKPPAKMRGHERLAYLAKAVLDLASDEDLDLVAVEGPAFGAKGDAYHQLAGQWWFTTHCLWANQIPFVVIPPSCVKRYACGKGNGSKDDVMREVARRFPWFDGDNNAADALVLAAIAADHLGAPMAAVPATHRAALRSIEWPTVSDISGDGATC